MSSPAALEIRHLRYFIAVAEELNFTRAAQLVGTSQPSLSQQIRQLEAIVGAELFDRDRHHVALTNAGKVLLCNARDILGKVDRAVRSTQEAAEGNAGNLSVGTFASADVLVFPSLRQHMKKQLPKLSLTLHSKYALNPVEGLRNGVLDVAFLRGPQVLDDLETVELLHERIVVVLPQHHPLTRRKRIAARNLDDLPSVALECAHAPALHDVTETFFRHSGICRRVIMTADSVLGALQLVQEGHGFALLPESFEALLPYGVVVRTLDADPEPTVSLEIAWKAGNTSRVVGEFVKLVRQCCADCDGAEQAARYRAALHQSGSGDSRLGL